MVAGLTTSQGCPDERWGTFVGASMTTAWIFRLALVVAVLGGVAATAGILGGPPVPVETVTVRGDAALLYGSGLYRSDTLFSGAAFRGTDVVTLLLGVPLLLLFAVRHRRGSPRGSLLLAGALCYFLYVYASLTFATAFNELFLLYVALLGTSFWAFTLLLGSLLANPPALREPLPRRGAGTFLIVAGVVTAVIWVEAPLSSLMTGSAPAELGTYTTLFTHALDMAIIAPAVVLAGLLLMRGDHRGVVLAIPLLCLLVALLPVMAAQTWAQLAAGITFSPGQVVGIIGGFGVLALAGAAVLRRLLVAVPSAPRAQQRAPRRVAADGQRTGVKRSTV